MAKDIVKQLCTRGTFVMLGAKMGMVRRFNHRSNECLVQWGATGLIDSLAGRGGLNDDLLRHQGMASDHHFMTLRLANDDVVAEMMGEVRP